MSLQARAASQRRSLATPPGRAAFSRRSGSSCAPRRAARRSSSAPPWRRSSGPTSTSTPTTASGTRSCRSESATHGISQSLRDWVNSGLMTFFFFVVGLEVRREFDVGELRERRRVALPLAAALGGMLVPIAIYSAINAGEDSASGWGVAMSTDTAFALGVLALLGSRFPERLRGFVLTLVVIDDMIALGVIALVYSSDVEFGPLRDRGRVLRGDPCRARGAHPAGGPVLRARRRGLGRAVRVRRRSRRARLGRWADHLGLPRRPRRARARHRPLSQLSRAADAGAGALGAGRPARRRLAKRPPPAALPPLDQLRDRAPVRARQRRHPAATPTSSRMRTPRL